MNDSPSPKPRVLVIDDEPQIRRLLQVCLEMNDYEVVEAETGVKGIEQAIQWQPDIVLLDLGLPDMNGTIVLKRLREWTQSPVIVLSVKNREADKIAALDGGANDYITKPFGTGELLARLRVTRRNISPQSRPEALCLGDISIDLVARIVKVRGQTVKMTVTEYALLLLFMKHAGKVLTHSHLLREIWGTTEVEKTAVLRVYIGYLREKLEVDPTRPRFLVTEPGVGYRLSVTE
jgi:two-component system KDP operon response regulator KdpE